MASFNGDFKSLKPFPKIVVHVSSIINGFWLSEVLSLGMHEMFSELSLGNYVTITHQLLNSRL
jgi:hypothetical protein